MTSGEELRLAKPEELKEIYPIWKQAFGDDDAFIADSLQVFAGAGHVYVAVCGGKVLAQLLAVPCTAGNQKGIYMYALATLEAAQKQGVMGRLMLAVETAEAEKGAYFSVLIPASEHLYTYYYNRGYSKTLYLRLLEQNVVPTKVADADFSPLTAARFSLLRAKYISIPYLNFTQPRLDMLLQDLYESGFETIVTDSGYSIYIVQQNHNRVLLAELFAKNDDDAAQIMRAVAAKTGTNNLLLTLAQGDVPFVNKGKLVRTALLKPLTKSGFCDDLYLRFGFDNSMDLS